MYVIAKKNFQVKLSWNSFVYKLHKYNVMINELSLSGFYFSMRFSSNFFFSRFVLILQQLQQVIEPLLPEPPEYQNIQGLPPPRESCGKLRDILTQPPNPNVIPGLSQHNNQHLHRVHYVSRTKSEHSRPTERKPSQTKKYSHSHDSPLWVKSHSEWRSKNDITLAENVRDPYVKIVKKPPSFHEYSYPSFQGFGTDPDKRKANHINVVTSQPPPSPPNKPPLNFPQKYHKNPTNVLYSGNNNTKRCSACQEYFNPEKNRRGACRDGTDPMNSCIKKVSCICCAEGMIYHCCPSDSDEPEVLNPCSCDMSNTSCYQKCQRWLGLGLLSLLVPCLWCYLPLKCCHWCGVQCGCCGARHEAV